MASKSISQLTTTNSLSDNDLFIVSKELGGTFVTYKIPFKSLNIKTTKAGIEAVLTGEISTHNHSWANIANKPIFAAVATSGSYSDLLNKPSLSAVAFSGSYTDLTNKPTIPTLPTLATVATTGSYADLINKPSLFSGSYADLTNKPTIGNATITVKQGGVTKGSFTANQTTDVTINLDATTQSGTVSSSDILNTVLTGLDGFQSSGAVVATDTILKAIRKLRDQIAVLTAPPNYGSVSDIGGEGYYPFAVSDGVLYTETQTITIQPGFYRIVCASASASAGIVQTYAQRKITGEYLARAVSLGSNPTQNTTLNTNISTTGTNAAFAGRGDRKEGISYYDPNGYGLGEGDKNTFLKFLFNGILDIVKPTSGDVAMVSHIVHITEPTEVYLYMGVTNSSAMIGKSIIWIRQVPAP